MLTATDNGSGHRNSDIRILPDENIHPVFFCLFGEHGVDYYVSLNEKGKFICQIKFGLLF